MGLVLFVDGVGAGSDDAFQMEVASTATTTNNENTQRTRKTDKPVSNRRLLFGRQFESMNYE